MGSLFGTEAWGPLNAVTHNQADSFGAPSEASSPVGSLRVVKVAVIVVFLWMFRTIFTGQIYVTDDLLNYHYPIRQFYQSCLKNGDSFDWMPSLFSGFYLTGSGQAGTYHPFHWLLYRFLPLDTAFNLEILSSYPLMFAGMLLFLRRHLMSPEAVWLGAITFTFSGFCTLHFLHPNAIAVVSHIPWLLYCLDCILRPVGNRGIVRAEVGLALLTGSQILLGYPQYVWYSVLAEIVYCLMVTTRNVTWLRRITFIALLKILGVSLAAVQLLPSMEALSESERTSMSTETLGLLPLSPADLLQWISPYLTSTRVFGQNTHELGAYFGAVPLVLVVVCCTRLRTLWKARPLFRMAIVLFVLALWLSFGRDGWLYNLQTQLPFVGKFRWPSRIVVLIHLAAAILSAIAIDFAIQQPEARLQLSRMIRKFWAIPILSVVVSAGVYSSFRSVPPAPFALLVIGPVLSGLAVLMLKEFANGKAATGLLLFVVGDLVSYGFTYEALARVESREQVMAKIHRPPGSTDSGKVLAETHGPADIKRFAGNHLVLAGYHQADGYEGLVPKIYLPDDNMTIETLRIMGVRWVSNARSHSAIADLVPTPDGDWLENPNPLPRFRLSHRAIVEQDPRKAATLVSDTVDVLSKAIAFDSSELQLNETIVVIADRPGCIELEVNCTRDRLLLLNERYSAGWKATIADKSVIPVRANADFMALPIERGTQRLALVFAPDGIRDGKLISLIALGLLALLTLSRVATRAFSRRNP